MLVTPDGVVAYWFLSGGAWALEEPHTDPLQDNCRKALDALLAVAVSRGVLEADCAELVSCLKTEPRGERAQVLAVLIASEIPDEAAERVTDAYLTDFAGIDVEPGPEEIQLLTTLAMQSNFPATAH